MQIFVNGEVEIEAILEQLPDDHFELTNLIKAMARRLSEETIAEAFESYPQAEYDKLADYFQRVSNVLRERANEC